MTEYLLRLKDIQAGFEDTVRRYQQHDDEIERDFPSNPYVRDMFRVYLEKKPYEREFPEQIKEQTDKIYTANMPEPREVVVRRVE